MRARRQTTAGLVPEIPWAAPAQSRHLEPTGCAALSPALWSAMPCGGKGGRLRQDVREPVLRLRSLHPVVGHTPGSGGKRNGRLISGRARAQPSLLRSTAWQRVAWCPDRIMLPKIPSERAGGGCSATMPAAQLPIRYAVLVEWPVNQRLRACLGSRPALRGRVEYVQVGFVHVGEHHTCYRPARCAQLRRQPYPRRITSAAPDDVSTPVLE
jgi:hypothetical protein